MPVNRGRGEQRGYGSRLAPFLPTGQAEALKDGGGELGAQREADRVTVNQFAPPGVLVNAELQVLQFRGPTGAYLEPAAGKASFDVLKMARDGLMLPLRAAINQARKNNERARRQNVRIQQNGNARTVNLEVIPLKNLRERCFLILFTEADKAGGAADRAQSPKTAEARGPRKGARAAPKVESRRVDALERDLSETREYLQSIQEQHEAANEELQAANEEVQSANEELQSINEELETSKEELESTNEELTTVNEEMANRNAELNRLNSDLANLQTSTKLAIVLLGRDLTIRRFSTQAEKQFNLLSADIGRPFGSVRHNLVLVDADALARSADPDGNARSQDKGRASAGRRAADAEARVASPPRPTIDLDGLIAEVIASMHEREHDVRDAAGRWYSLRIRPYITLDNKVDGAVLVLVDIDALKRSEREIAAARDYAEAIVRTSRDPLLVLDADLRVNTANDAFYTLFKVSAAESIGRFIYEVGSGQWNVPRLRQMLTDILPRNSFFNEFEVTYDFESLGRRTMLLNARTLRGPSGTSKQILLGIQDVTETLQFQAVARESAAKFRLLFERSPLPKWAYDLETLQFVDVNQAAVAKYGYGHEEFLRMRVPDMLTPESTEALLGTLSNPPHRPPERTTARHRKAGGEIIDVDIQGNEIALAGRRVWLATINDVTERNQAELSLARMAAELVEADRRKDEFLALLAHELRGPLAPLRNLLGILQRGGEDAEVVGQATFAMQRQLGQMTRLIDDLLDASRITRGKLALRPSEVELAPLINHAIDTARPGIDAARQVLTLELPEHPIYVNADPMRLAQVFSNLLSNAAKFSDPGGTISLIASEQGDEVAIEVKDTGIGIDAEQLPRIFEMFVQVDRSLERSRSGLGIGLTLARQLIEMHGGSLQAFSEGLGRGSAFVVRLPIVERTLTDPPEAAGSETTVLTGRRILVVDDNRDAAQSLATLLDMSGNETTTAHDGIAAVEAAAAFRPDVALLDIGLPKLNGYEVARRIRREPWGKTVVLVAVTGWGQEEDRQRSKAAGFDYHLVKPVDYALLATLLSESPRSPP